MILVLGGTAEARELAERVPVTTSLAGRLSRPHRPVGVTRHGGFGGVYGMVRFLDDQQVDAVIDATHPFAQQISENAVAACASLGTPLLRLQRPGWVAVEGDRWTRVPSLEAAASAVGARSVLLATGRQEVAPFVDLPGRVVLRAIERPDDVPAHWTVVLGRPPWSLESERALLASHAIEVVVTKDSGGAASPKLVAARETGLEVVVVDRPPVLAADVVETVDACVAWLAGLT